MSEIGSGEQNGQIDPWQAVTAKRAANLRRANELYRGSPTFYADTIIYGPQFNGTIERPVIAEGLFIMGKCFPGSKRLGQKYRIIVLQTNGELAAFEGRTDRISPGGYPTDEWSPEYLDVEVLSNDPTTGIVPRFYNGDLEPDDCLQYENELAEALERAAVRYPR